MQIDRYSGKTNRNSMNTVGRSFQLHQATERFLATILLIFTGYKPKIHDLTDLCRLAVNQALILVSVFPKTTETERKRFSLLRRAYIDARYQMKHFEITYEDLDWLGERVEKLQSIEEICVKKIACFTKG